MINFCDARNFFIIITDTVMMDEVNILDKSPGEQFGSEFFLFIY